MVIAGIDAGSRYTKAVLLDGEGRVVGSSIVRTRADIPEVAKEALEVALERAGLERREVRYIAATGFGRYNVPFRDVQVTEITSGAKGAVVLFPRTSCVLDIGFQSTRAVRIEGGKVKEFASNDKCAAGAGGFLERAARYLEVPLAEIGSLSLRAKAPKSISSICAVLAETEIINHLTAGVTVEDIVGGIHQSLAARALALLKRVGLQDEVTFIGGLGLQEGMVRALEEALGRKVNVPEDPQLVCALGAAVLARQRLERLMTTEQKRV